MDELHDRAAVALRRVADRGDVDVAVAVVVGCRVWFCTIARGSCGFPYETVVNGQDDRSQRHG